MTLKVEPLAEIRESEATGATAEIYRQIRDSIGVPMVNLVFRNMATAPGCLEWAWAHLGPLYRSGAVADAAIDLTSDPALDQIVDFDADTVDAPVEQVAQVGAVYARANPMNLIGLLVVDRLLNNTVARSMGQPARGPAADPRPAPMVVLPPMIDLARAPANVFALLESLAHQLHQGDNGVIPSLYRHFGQWPGFLAALQRQLAPAVDNGSLFGAAAAMERRGADLASDLSRQCPAVDARLPDAAVASRIGALINTFPANICRMTIVARALARLNRRSGSL